MAGRKPLSVEGEQFRALFGKASQVEPKLKAALRKRMKAAADLAAVDVRNEVLKTPRSHGRGSRGLRKGIAAGVKVTISASPTKVGVMIQASGSNLPADMRPLVRAYNKPTFRHPVFGSSTWVQQAGRPYFKAPIEARQGDVQAAVEAAMREAIESLTD